MKNEAKSTRLLTIMVIMLMVILLIGTAVVIILLNSSKESSASEPTIDEIVEASVDIPEMTTNLASDDYIRISFKIQTDSKEAQEELTKRDFQAKNLIIEQLSEMTAAKLKGKAGKEQLTNELKKQLNEIMQDGQVVDVYITSYIIQ
ncbi:flagellar basal body-associated protein FliL [Bacillus thermotolerans]|uniref:flagellar basal body-associated protein FliL n=1 Tax=Bacillus thermotolerans TaxID=1221996 RepID=UPI00057EDA3D|nr:flagellar basal body-associated protein FliL [Bacillus thermotolerans]KKB38969.1 Flagellar biosynthesis protein FliL [Bacillus thermotolerans]